MKRLKITIKLPNGDTLRLHRHAERKVDKELSLLREEYPNARNITVTEVR